MKVYRLHIAPTEYLTDGVDYDEWFLSLEMAKRRRAVLIREAEHPDSTPPKYPDTFKIERYEVRKLRLPELVIALLNKRGWSAGSETVVPEHTIKQRVVPLT